MQSLMLIAAFCLSFVVSSFSQNYSNLKIAPPPHGGMYLGQYQIVAGDIDTFEAAAGKKAAWWGMWGVDRDSQGHPVFDPADAEAEWARGRVVLVEAYEAIPDSGSMLEGVLPLGFTVDKLLSGNYETQLTALAAQFRLFGKPMFFNTAREPLGVGKAYMGGFGPDGTKSLQWALENKRGLAEFNPTGFPNATLYADLGDPLVSDGVERLVAAQRYYHDFFVRRQGLNFLTFETMGYTPLNVPDELQELKAEYPSLDTAYARTVLETSSDFANFYPGNAYVDWISTNFYTMDFYAADWGLNEDFLVPTQYYLDEFAARMASFRAVALGKPVLFLELGFPDGMNRDSQRAADRIRDVFADFLPKYPEIGGISLWSDHPSFHTPNTPAFFPFDCLIRPGTKQAAAFRKVLNDNPGKFHSCVYFSNQTTIPTCQTTISFGARPFFYQQDWLSVATAGTGDILLRWAASPNGPQNVAVRFYDIHGRLSGTTAGQTHKGVGLARWNHRGKQNRAAASGCYFLTVPQQNITVRFQHVRP